MAQWGQGQQGYQYPQQTGFPGQNSQFQPQNLQFQPNPNQFQQNQQFQQQGGLPPQQTGFPGPPRPPSGFQQPQQTGFIQSQPTGYLAQYQQQHRAPPPPPPVPPIPNQFQQQGHQGNSFLGVQQQPNRFLSPSPGLGGPGLAAQPTGFGVGGGMGGGLVPQMTGFVDPRLQMMQSSFMPLNMSTPYNAAGAPQLQAQQQGAPSLQQSFQQHNEERGTTAPKIPWTLSKAEKKTYDQTFRAWDTSNSGFLSGSTALDVFGKSGLDQNDLARIWTLADGDNRGKLNLAEFHVAMGLIYRKLNGNDIPDILPPELVPPSSRDLDASVNFLKDVLKNDSRDRSPSGFDTPVSRMKERSFASSPAGAGGRQDATVYKHTDDSSPPGGFYQPRSRHIDRSAIRTRDDDSASSNLADMKRQLDNTAKMLEKSAAAEASRTQEDEELEREMEDVQYRIKRIQDDIAYVSRGPRSHGKDEERRKLERELLKLMHERVPELERRVEDREARKDREKREWGRDRDRRNDRFGRYDDRDRERDGGYKSPTSRYDDERDGRYSRGGDDYNRRERDRNSDQYRSDSRNRSRDRERDYDQPRSPPKARSPPPAPPPEPSGRINNPPPPAPKPTASPAPNTKNMTAEERKAYLQAQAQARIQARMQALGVTSAGSASSPTLDTSVEDRLAQEKKEAEEKAKVAEEQAAAREKARRERLDGERGVKTPVPTPTATAPAPSPVPKIAAPAPKPRAPAPPPPRKTPAARPMVTTRAAPAPAPSPMTRAPLAPPPPPAQPEVDPEEEKFKAREEQLREQREARAERMRQLEQEEEEARRAEEAYESRRKALSSRTDSPASSIVMVTPPANSPPPPIIETVPPPPPPPPPPAPPVLSTPTPASSNGTPSAEKSSTNPFNRLMNQGASPSPVASPPAATKNNPFSRPTAAASTSGPPPPKSSYNTASAESDDDWNDIAEKDADDSSDDELDGSRDRRNQLAARLFGSIVPPARPASTGPPATQRTSTPSTPVGGPLTAPPTVAPAPPAPALPSAPPAPQALSGVSTSVASPAPPGDRNALLSSIQGGARLKKTITNDRSAASVSGLVVGDSGPPTHINAAPRPPSPPAVMPQSSPLPHGDDSSSSKRHSVDWYAGLAADHGAGSITSSVNTLPSFVEEDEPEEEERAPVTPVPTIHVEEEPLVEAESPMDDIDTSVHHQVRSLYPYEGQRPEDLSFGENLILTASPSKSGGEWWYGKLTREGKSGFFPQAYVQTIQPVTAVALYSYTGTNEDELPFAEGDHITIVDRTEDDWWKAEQGGVVFIVPAAYLEVEG